MSAGSQVHPEADSWIAAIHRSPDDDVPFAGGIVLDDRRILTCAHVAEQTASLCVSFPKAEGDVPESRYPVDDVVLADGHGHIKDLAILVLPEPVPASVVPAPLRCPKPGDLVSKRWWVFGFPDGHPVGNTAAGQVGDALGRGWVRLDTASRYPVAAGFSGGGLWSPDYQAVVGVVGQANDENGDGLAITLHQADQWLPDQKLRILAERGSLTAAGEVALSAWGWSLTADPEGRRHWRPRARGVSVDSELGYRFCGRTAALRAIVTWLDRDTVDRRVLVVTGAPGAGKSAVLGRIVTTADAGAVAQLPGSDVAVRAAIGSVACAVHAKGLTTLDVARQIAQAASAALPERVEDFAPALRDALTERAGARFNVIIDALDEAASPAEARLLVSKVITPMAETCADVGAQVVVGTRRADGDGELLEAFGGVARLVDLGTPEFFAEEDLAAYALATLQLAGDEGTGNPYADDTIAEPVAVRIAALSDSNFLVAGLTARTHGLYDEEPTDPETLSFSPKVDDAMRQYLAHIPPLAGVPAETLLAALAFAEPPGLPLSLWRVAVRALAFSDVSDAALLKFARSSAMSFVVESSTVNGTGEFRLFHQALDDALLHARARTARRREDEQALTRAFMAVGQEAGWADRASTYLLRGLPAHAARAGLIDELLTDGNYLLHADLRRVQPIADRATSGPGRQRARLLRLAPRDLLTADPPNRAAMLSVTEAVEDLPRTYTPAAIRTPYRAEWAVVPPSTEHSILGGHSRGVSAACAFALDDTSLLATADGDGTVRIWDLAAGATVRVLTADDGEINAICDFVLGSTTVLATPGAGGTVRIWDPTTGATVRTLTGHHGRVAAMCAVALDDAVVLATGSTDGTVRIWDPANGATISALTGHGGGVRSVCTFVLDGTPVLAAVSADSTIQLWDVVSGSQIRAFSNPYAGLSEICALVLDGTTLLATVGSWVSDGVDVRIRDPVSGACPKFFAADGGGVDAVCPFTLDGTTVIAVACGNGVVQIWDPIAKATIRTLTGHYGAVTAVCVAAINGTTVLATGGSDGTVRIWDLSTDTDRHTLAGHQDRIGTACAIARDGKILLATVGGDGAVRIRDSGTGASVRTLSIPHTWISAMCAFALDGTMFLATVGDNWSSVRIWDPGTGTATRTISSLRAMYAFALARSPEYVTLDTLYAFTTDDGTPLLAASTSDHVVRIWELSTGIERGVLTLRAHRDQATALCALDRNGTTFLATAGDDPGIIWIWDLATGALRDTLTLAAHRGQITAIRAVAVDGSSALVTTGDHDGTIWIWDPATGTRLGTLTGHRGPVKDIHALAFDGTTFLATAGSDGTVRIWDPAKEVCIMTVPTRDPALSLGYADGLLFVGTVTGLLAIRLDLDFLAHPA